MMQNMSYKYLPTLVSSYHSFEIIDCFHTDTKKETCRNIF
jgi:hypothetical protein